MTASVYTMLMVERDSRCVLFVALSLGSSFKVIDAAQRVSRIILKVSSLKMLDPILAQAPPFIGAWSLGLLAVTGVLLLVIIPITLSFGMIYIRALFSGARVTFTELIALKLRRIPVGLIVDSRIASVRSGVTVTIDGLSTHFLAGGDVRMLVLALIASKKAGIHLIFDRACAIDLATKGTGKTLIEAVRTSINPRVIGCPALSDAKKTIDGVARDGIVIKARALVTVRTNLDRFVGGATEETIIARVAEGIVSAIGSSPSYKDILEHPNRISRAVLDKALDANTAYEILSLDIADLDVGDNVGAHLQAEQAEANKLIAQAHAEVRRAAAVAVTQEMKARVAEMRARVVDAESQIPLAMSAAFRAGVLGLPT
jgi:uncharacterized protein YqfA (UPF0365 family)